MDLRGGRTAAEQPAPPKQPRTSGSGTGVRKAKRLLPREQSPEPDLFRRQRASHRVRVLCELGLDLVLIGTSAVTESVADGL